MARFKEPLTGGLVTILDPSSLQPGQLSDARNCLYLPGAGALQRAAGRVAFGTVTANGDDVTGIRDATFNNGDAYLFVTTTAQMRQATVGDTGTFSTISGVGGGNSLEAVQYRNRFYFFNGTQLNGPMATTTATAANTNVVQYLSATAAGSSLQTRTHGLIPVDATPTGTTAGGSTFSQSVTGYYEYWTTEVQKGTQDGAPFAMESTFIGTPASILVSATSVVPTIFFPPQKNPNTTHWRIYRSAAKPDLKTKLFPAGFQIAEMAIITGASATGAAASATAVPDSVVATASASALPTDWNHAGTLYSDMAAQASALTAADNVYGAMAVPGGSGGRWQGVFNFAGLGSFYGNVVGITVELKAFWSGGSGDLPILVTIGPKRAINGDFGWNYKGNGFTDNGSGYHTGVFPPSKGVYVTASAAGQVITLGSSTDRWVPNNSVLWSSSDFDANFMVVLYTFQQNRTLNVDYVKVTVTYGAVSDTTLQFPQVNYTFGDVTAQVGRNGPPPSSNTGDMYQDQLVVNDIAAPSIVRYSYPGDPDAFPSTYYIDFQTRENDRVRCIKTVNNRLLIWLDSSMWRANYLPSERDASFDRGKAIDLVARYGCFNPMCATTFSMDGRPEMAAWVSDQGIHITDGFSFETISDGLDWRTIISTTVTSYPIALVNDLDRRVLLFYFRNDSYGNETHLCLPLSYHRNHLEADGSPKVGGLQHVRNFDAGTGAFGDVKSAWTVGRASGNVSTYIGYGNSTAAGAGKVYIEQATAAIPANDPRMKYTTRRIYASEMGGEWECGEVYGTSVDYASSTPTVAYTLLKSKTNDSGEITGSTKTLTLVGQSLHKVTFREQAEGIRIQCVATATSYAAESLTIDGTGFGLEDSGR